MYRMATDQIPQEEKKGLKVCRNIGNTFIKIGKYRDTIQNYESAMSSSPDHKTYANSFLFYVIIGYEGKSKRCFTKIMSLTLNKVGEKEGNFTPERNNFRGGERCCDLYEEELSRCSKASEHVVITQSLLVDSVFNRGKQG